MVARSVDAVWFLKFSFQFCLVLVVSEPDFVDTCVIGAGVVGLAVARSLAVSGLEVLVLESGPRFGEGVSSRNSEVIHAGIYYPEGSLKANLCVQGKELLYAYCAERQVGHQRIGKLIVANGEVEEAELVAIRAAAEANGVTDLIEISQQRLLQLEPAISATAALLSPSTGIVSAPELMTSFLGDLEAHRGSLACHAELRGVTQTTSGFLLDCDIEGQTYGLACRQLVNSAGLGAQSVAKSIVGLDHSLIPELHLCKGNYFHYQGKCPFSHLIYPVPEPGGAGLGVHATIDLGGQVKFGPDVEYVEHEDYEVSSERLAQSLLSIRRYFPTISETDIAPGYAGVRPKLQGPGEPVRDFQIHDAGVHGIPGLVNLFGIESPGLTSSMAIAETVAARLAS
jgi:L-2-hydroxyglutarate oxidase LhgO